MHKTTANLLRKTRVPDEYGGSTTTLETYKTVTGYFVPNTQTKAVTGAKINVETVSKFICDVRVDETDVMIEIDGVNYAIESIKHLYSKGSSLVVKTNG